MRLLSTASAIALAAALAVAPALAAPPTSSTDTGGTSAATTPGSGNPAHAPVNNTPKNNAPNNAAAGAAGTGATTNPGALGTAPNPGAGTAPAGTAANAPAGGAMAPAATSNAPSNRNPVLTDNGEIRASKAIGSAVYDSHDKQIGSIDDILLDPKTHQAATAVISVGGFLGMGAKLVSVPYDKLQFGNANKNGDNRVVMPDASKDALNKMPSYHYTAANSKG